MVDIINGLFKMSLLIRHPSRRDELSRKAEQAVKFEPFDASHVSSKFPNANEFLVQRLAAANALRRANLAYWERHHAKMAIDAQEKSDDLEEPAQGSQAPPLSGSQAPPLSGTIATEPLANVLSWSRPTDLADLEGTLSVTSYGSSLTTGRTAKMPPRPEAASTGPFECPICFFLVTARSQESWIKHVFLDLRPYVCLFEPCHSPNKQYSSRSDWYEHELSEHIVPLLSKEPTSLHCPLCFEKDMEKTTIRRHLAKHLEELALFVLPARLLDDDTQSENAENVDILALAPDQASLDRHALMAEGARRLVLLKGEGLFEHYNSLRLDYDTSQRSIEKAHEELRSQPTESMSSVISSYNVLSDPTRRNHYDEFLIDLGSRPEAKDYEIDKNWWMGERPTSTESATSPEDIPDIATLVHQDKRYRLEFDHDALASGELYVHHLLARAAEVLRRHPDHIQLFYRGELLANSNQTTASLGISTTSEIVCLDIGTSLEHIQSSDRELQLIDHVDQIQERTLPEDHPHQLTSQHALAGAYQDSGQIKKAVQLLEHVVQIRERSLPEDHPDRLSLQYELASAYLTHGQFKEAARLLEHVVQIRERSLPEDHPHRLASQQELARAYLSNGQIKEAVQLLEHVIQIQERRLPEDHLHRLLSQHELARAYLNNGQIKEAVQLLEHVVQIRERSLPEDHPYRLSSQGVLARAYLNNGQIKEAVQLLEHVVQIRERSLPEDHRDLLFTQQELARAYLH